MKVFKVLLALTLLASAFAARPALVQHSEYMNLVRESTKPAAWPSALEMLKIFLEEMTTTMDFLSDVFPRGRRKYIHSVGAVAPISFTSFTDRHNYTGLFQGANYGVLRVSSALKPDKNSAVGSLVPGGGFKFFRGDGVPSGNFVAMRSLNPQEDSWSFFKHTWTNHVSAKKIDVPTQLLAKKFRAAKTTWEGFVGLSDLARFDENGKEAARVSFPFQLLLDPTEAVASFWPDTYEKEYLMQLPELPPNTKLWTVRALECPSCVPKVIGEIKTTDRFTASSFGDQEMFFKHQRFEDDLILHPEWAQGDCKTFETCPVCPLDIPCPSTKW